MSRYTYAGPFKNPTEGWYVKGIFSPDGDHEPRFQIWIHHDREKDGSAEPDRRHTSAPEFECEEEAAEYIQGMQEFFEEDYSEYLDENGPEIARMEMYEDMRDEY